MIDRVFISPDSICQVCDCGIIDYGQALELLERIVLARIHSEIPDVILLLEHPSVITIGTSGNEDHIIASRELLRDMGISIIHVDRGGEITYHGPGQLICYPTIDLKARGIGLHTYVRNLEEVVIRTLSEFSIDAYRDSKYPGVWVGGEKICALGIRVRKWVTKHGFALNVNTDLSCFNYIIPCGIYDRKTTSMSRLLGYEIPLQQIITSLIEQFADTFNIRMEYKSIDDFKRKLCTASIHCG